MTDATFPSASFSFRQADMAVHAAGLALILGAGGTLVAKAILHLDTGLAVAVVVYVLCALVSNLASWAYHFLPLHDRRTLLRRLDHAAIYSSITGTFTPFFVMAGTPWTMGLLWVCWGLTALAMWNKISSDTVKSRWSTASYLGLGALGLTALPAMTGVPVATLWCILAGSACYVVGTAFYVRRTMPYRYAIWHVWVNLGGIAMFAGVWLALSPLW